MKRVLFIVLVAICLVFPTRAQNTEGTEFWLTFGKNHTNFAAGVLQIRIAGGSQQTTGTIYFTNINTTINFDIVPYGIFNHYLNPTQASAVYNTVMGISNFSVHIIASNPVTVYAYNATGTYAVPSDATNVLPVETLGTEYYQISHQKCVNNWVEGDAYAVVATQNNTQIFHNGVPVSVLNAGQVYYRISGTDMTGNRITSNNPIAFFAVCQSAAIPFGTTSGDSHLFQQLAPVNTWGRTFFVPVSLTEKNIVRIVAAYNGTIITQTGGTIRTGVPGAQTSLTNLQAGQFVELDIHINDIGCHIQANRPVGVCSYFTTNSYSIPGSVPAQCWIPVIEQKIVSVKLAPFITNPPQLMNHYALITTSTDNKDNTKVSIGGGTPSNLSGGIWKDNIPSGMSFYNIPLTNETQPYVFTNSKGLIIYGYGYNYSGLGSYYYLAGSAMRDLDAYFTANDIHYQDLKDNPICESEITFRAEIEGLHPTSTERIKWYVNGEHQPAGFNQETWSRSFSAGEYEIRMWVRYENNDTVNKIGTLKICNLDAAFFANEVHNEVLPDTTFCNKTVHFRAETGALSSEPGHIRWYIDYNDGNGYVEEPAGFDQTQWSKDFANGTYPVKMWVLFENGEDATVTSMLKIQTLWIKIRNVRY